MKERRVVVDGFGYRVLVAGRGPTVVLLHGFTGRADGWAPFVPTFARRWRVVAPDLPGHGGTDTPRPGEERSLERTAADLTGLLDHFGAEDAAVVGYSLGGRLAWTWAAVAPNRLRALVLEGASPGIADGAERAARRRRDEALASFIEKEGMAAFVARWEKLPLFASQRTLDDAVRRRVREIRLSQRPAGLAAALRGMGPGVMKPLHGRLPGMDRPALLMAGALDETYCRVLAAAARRMPRATLRVVADAGHAVHVERPEAWLALVDEFLTSGEGGGRAGGPSSAGKDGTV